MEDAARSWPEGDQIATALADAGVTHVVWIPDSSIGKWDPALSTRPGLTLIRACREGEAIAVGAGLLLGGARPVVLMQCTGFFEAGDALRNVIHDMGVPLFLVVGVRNYYGHREGTSRDTAPRFAQSIADAWEIPRLVLADGWDAAGLADLYRTARAENRAQLVLIAE